MYSGITYFLCSMASMLYVDKLKIELYESV